MGGVRGAAAAAATKSFTRAVSYTRGPAIHAKVVASYSLPASGKYSLPAPSKLQPTCIREEHVGQQQGPGGPRPAGGAAGRGAPAWPQGVGEPPLSKWMS